MYGRTFLLGYPTSAAALGAVFLTPYLDRIGKMRISRTFVVSSVSVALTFGAATPAMAHDVTNVEVKPHVEVKPTVHVHGSSAGCFAGDGRASGTRCRSFKRGGSAEDVADSAADLGELREARSGGSFQRADCARG